MYGSTFTGDIKKGGRNDNIRYMATNFGTILFCIGVPWMLFVFMFWLMGFHLHFKHQRLVHFIVFLTLFLVVLCGWRAFNAARRGARADIDRQPTWTIFLFVTMALAWLLGLLLGDLNFHFNMEPYYQLSAMKTYESVDPAATHGQQLMDAGKVIFAPGSKLDLSRSMGFRNIDVFCVAPITMSDSEATRLDFWAVGLNCCTGGEADFRCGEYNGEAHAGVRVMRAEQRAFYELAVQQAEAAYKLKAVHPLFFLWMKDPVAEVDANIFEGVKQFTLGTFLYFIFQLFLVMSAVFALSKLGDT